jgi:hypothetical protein
MVAGLGEDLRIFSTNEFKPPSDWADGKNGEPGGAPVSPKKPEKR